MYKDLYSRFIEAHPEELHFACHSHHYWPDISRNAHLQYWDDACKYVDDKWAYFFTQKIPRAQSLIAEILGLTKPQQIVFAPNTHEFVFRILSSLDWNKKIRILTTDSEFYSFDRQINRLGEFENIEITKVPTLPFNTFHERFEKEMNSSSYDLIFISHVFFNSGLVCDVDALVKKAPPHPVFVIDGYHSFMAVPLNLTPIEDRAFYLAGSYKYAQGGEGGSFLHVPSDTQHRPFFTGWFAELSQLSAIDGKVGYPVDAMQYAGSTMDFSSIYRLIAVLELFKQKNLTVQRIHATIQNNQKIFLKLASQSEHPLFNISNLILTNVERHGHFLTFKMPSVEKTKEVGQQLLSLKIKTDSRGDRLRFGFGLYHDAEDIRKVWTLLAKVT